MAFEDDNFDLYHPDRWKGAPEEWQRRANLLLDAAIREARSRQEESVMFGRNAMTDFVAMFSPGGESGTSVDGELVMDKEREELIAKIVAGRKKTIGTGLASCDGN